MGFSKELSASPVLLPLTLIVKLIHLKKNSSGLSDSENAVLLLINTGFLKNIFSTVFAVSTSFDLSPRLRVFTGVFFSTECRNYMKHSAFI